MTLSWYWLVRGEVSQGHEADLVNDAEGSVAWLAL
jgi:hypothetical protein